MRKQDYDEMKPNSTKRSEGTKDNYGNEYFYPRTVPT